MLPVFPALRSRLALVLVCTFSAAIAEPTDSADPSADAPPLDNLPSMDLNEPESAPSAELVTPTSTPSQNAMTNLINLLVAKGNLSAQEGNALVAQAEADAAAARAAAAADPVEEGEMRVPYIPEVVRARMRDEIKDDVMAAARAEKWTALGSQPDWVNRYKPFGDIRLRYEYLSYPVGNDNTGAFPNFNAINTGSPFDISGTLFSPQYNVDQDRQRVRLRARMGLDVNLEEGFTGGLRIATGENNSPITTNQSLGLASGGQGGNFSKYALWVDRAFLKFELGGKPDQNLALLFGRFDNPYMSTDLIYDEDLGFDGAAIAARIPLGSRLTAFATGSFSPIFNTDLNFSTNQPSKFKSTDKWLYGGQVGLDWKVTKKVTAKAAVAYYDFHNAEGKLSDPYIPLTALDAGNTDNTRPSFAQKGNTYRPLRNIIPSALNNFGTTNQFQYFGLATPFQVLTFDGRIDFNNFEPFQISLLGQYAKNLAFDDVALQTYAVNNRGPQEIPKPTTTTTTTTAADGAAVTEPTPIGKYAGGDTAWLINMQFGKPAFEKRWDWNFRVGYRYVESDAVIDGFNDSEFGGGGTNVKGFTVGGSLALSKRVKLNLLWMSGEQIAGPPLKTDIISFDISTKF